MKFDWQLSKDEYGRPVYSVNAHGYEAVVSQSIAARGRKCFIVRYKSPSSGWFLDERLGEVNIIPTAKQARTMFELWADNLSQPDIFRSHQPARNQNRYP